MRVFALTIGLGAYLVFQVQPLMARAILPWFGGAPAVWTTCMLFFQVGLLLGYAYAHALTTRLSPRAQALVHGGLLAVSLAFLPITPNEALRPDGTEEPIRHIVLLLTTSLMLPYVLLAATAPLVQHWWSRIYPSSPYRLYALSNAGSLAGLLLYPFVIEPWLGVRVQSWLWSGVYLFYVASWAGCVRAWLAQAGTSAAVPLALPDETPRPTIAVQALWLTLSGLGVWLLLATTHQMCRDVAVVPFLWIVPLGLYLMSFIIAFDAASWYRREIWLPFMVIAVVGVVYLLHRDYVGDELDLRLQVTIYAVGLFAACMVCHGELYAARPAPRDLTRFFLLVATGGALGGMFVNLAAPRLFLGYWELHLGLTLVVALGGVMWWRTSPNTPPRRRSVVLRRVGGGAWVVAVVLVGTFLFNHAWGQQSHALATRRNFFGILRVYESSSSEIPGTLRTLYHGRISHGDQHRDEPTRPTSYYGHRSGVARALRFHENRLAQQPLRVGIIGLGTGTIAAYAQSGDEFRFYEIDPNVERLARSHFRYLELARGEVEVILGDGRLSLERELASGGPRRFDVLVIDAFSGDAIPVHLLTAEAFELYLAHLDPHGILAVHVSNRHFDLTPVIRTHAADYGWIAAWFEDAGDLKLTDSSDWVLISQQHEFFRHPKIEPRIADWTKKRPFESIRWTDDHSNLFQVLGVE